MLAEITKDTQRQRNAFYLTKDFVLSGARQAEIIPCNLVFVTPVIICMALGK